MIWPRKKIAADEWFKSYDKISANLMFAAITHSNPNNDHQVLFCFILNLKVKSMKLSIYKSKLRKEKQCSALIDESDGQIFTMID